MVSARLEDQLQTAGAVVEPEFGLELHWPAMPDLQLDLPLGASNPKWIAGCLKQQLPKIPKDRKVITILVGFDQIGSCDCGSQDVRARPVPVAASFAITAPKLSRPWRASFQLPVTRDS